MIRAGKIKRPMVKKRKIARDRKVMELRRSRLRSMILSSSSGCRRMRWREVSMLDLHWDNRSHKG